MQQDALGEVVSFFHSFQLDALLFVNRRISSLATRQLRFYRVRHGSINWWIEDQVQMNFFVNSTSLENVTVVGRRNIEVSIAMALRDCIFDHLFIRWQYDEHSVLPRDVAAKSLLVTFWTFTYVAELIALLDRFRFINELRVDTSLKSGPIEQFIDTSALLNYCNVRGIQLQLGRST
ncbi:hypothetical protein AAVH_21800 [Aphelenchoides avenae]|nr:hypothetical protein AAVH_21800 [Aphelenchus avenae]